MITFNNYVTANGKYPDRLNSEELNDTVKANIKVLLNDVNAFLKEIGVENAIVSSGFRPSAVNGTIPGAAKKSLHLQGLAIDIKDVDGSIAKKAQAKPDIMRKYGIFLENPSFTKGWCHLDKGRRSDRPSRIFNP